VICVLRDGQITDLSTGVSSSVITTGRGFDWEMDTHPGTYAAPTNSDIHMVHGMLVTSPLPYEIKHTLIKDVKTTARVTICGHEHLGFGIIKRDDGKWFINPGALCRESASEAEMQRQVQVAILEIKKNASSEEDEIKAELVPITCARPAEEVLSREHIEAQVLRKEKMGYFLELLGREGEGRFLDVREIVESIADHESLPESVKKEAMKRIAAAREELAGRRGI
jgi:exonuclease SbcD